MPVPLQIQIAYDAVHAGRTKQVAELRAEILGAFESSVKTADAQSARIVNSIEANDLVAAKEAVENLRNQTPFAGLVAAFDAEYAPVVYEAPKPIDDAPTPIVVVQLPVAEAVDTNDEDLPEAVPTPAPPNRKPKKK